MWAFCWWPGTWPWWPFKVRYWICLCNLKMMTDDDVVTIDDLYKVICPFSASYRHISNQILVSACVDFENSPFLSFYFFPCHSCDKSKSLIICQRWWKHDEYQVLCSFHRNLLQIRNSLTFSHIFQVHKQLESLRILYMSQFQVNYFLAIIW